MNRLALLAFALCPGSALAADPAVEKALQKLQAGDYPAAADAAKSAVAADPKNPETHLLLGVARFKQHQNAEAIAAFTDAIRLDGKLIAAYDRRGDAHLRLAQFKESAADFDRVIELDPKIKPEHWRRGIALYYAGRYKDGVEQFETHKTVNPQDVENAVWHFLCNVPVVGLEKSREQLIDVTRDARVPMAEVQGLYAGKLQPKDVLKAAEETPVDTPRGTEARFYAHLYLALYFEAVGEPKRALEHLDKAVADYKIGHYMYDVAVAHRKMRTGPKK